LPDGDFVSQADLAADYRALVLSVRRAIGRCCKVPPETIYPHDIFEDLIERLMMAGWDELEFLLALRAETGLKIKQGSIKFPRVARWMFFWRVDPGMRVGEWITEVVPQLGKQRASGVNGI
jgi:hypothetical protein